MIFFKTCIIKKFLKRLEIQIKSKLHKVEINGLYIFGFVVVCAGLRKNVLVAILKKMYLIKKTARYIFACKINKKQVFINKK